MSTATITEDQAQTWLLAYAWLGPAEADAARVVCIMAQREWVHLDAMADRFAASTETGGGPAEYAEGIAYALSALYECHDGPHQPTCPDARTFAPVNR